MNQVTLAIITYDVDAPDGQELAVQIPEHARGMLAVLTDRELQIFAAEAIIHVQRAFELPPSPKP